MKKIIVLGMLVILYGCSQSKGDNVITEVVEIQHFNIIIAPDLSNRQAEVLYPKPLKDEKIVKVILQNIWPNILNHRRSDNQKDEISISLINKNLIKEYSIDAEKLLIDFGKFSTQKTRIDYIKGRSERNFSADTTAFIREYQKLGERSAKFSFGADIWSYFNAGLDDTVIKTSLDEYEAGGKRYRNVFRNILILLTDGYIEAEMYGRTGCDAIDSKQCYYLSSNRIKSFRQAFKASSMPDLQEFFTVSGQRIAPVTNKLLSSLEVLVLEVYDRSLTKAGVATAHPSDLEILRIFWNDWLTRSGVKRFEIRPVLATEAEAEEVIMNFIGVREYTSL